MPSRAAALLALAVVTGCGAATLPGAPDAGAADDGVPACEPDVVIDPATVTTWDAFVDAFGRAACAHSKRCLDLTAVWLLSCRPGFLAALVDPSTRPPLDVVAAQACLDALGAGNTCQAENAVVVQCASLLFRRGEAASFCGWDFDCYASTCTNVGYACRPTCAPWTGVGAPCDYDMTCLPGLACNDRRCGPLPTLGQPCGELLCAGDAICGPGNVCVAPAGEGEPCTLPESCARGLSCSSARVCVPIPGTGSWGSVGCACTTDDECPPSTTHCVRGVCRARPLRGEACSESGLECLDATCDGEVCRAFASGASCMSDAECMPGLACAFGVCRPPAALGEPCDAATCTPPTWCDRAVAAPVCRAPVGAGERCHVVGGPYCASGLACLRDVCQPCAGAP